MLYTGSELNRGGLVGLSILNAPIYPGKGTGAGLSGSYFNVDTLNREIPSVNRLGEMIHEVKWVPGFNDQEFVNLSTNPSQQDAYTPGSAILATVQNAPAGTILYEIVSCWETQPNAQQNGLVATVRAPESANTLNDVLRAIGNVTDFAVRAGNVMVPVIRTGLQAMSHIGATMAYI